MLLPDRCSSLDSPSCMHQLRPDVESLALSSVLVASSLCIDWFWTGCAPVASSASTVMFLYCTQAAPPDWQNPGWLSGPLQGTGRTSPTLMPLTWVAP